MSSKSWMSKEELAGVAGDIVTAIPGARVHVPDVGEFSTDANGRVILDRGVVNPLDDVRQDGKVSRERQ